MSEPKENTQAQDSAAEIEELAADFLQRRRFWKWAEEEQAQLDAWLNESLAHRAAFWRLEAGLNRAERLSALRLSAPDDMRPRISRAVFKAIAGAGAIAVLGIAVALYAYRPHGQTYATQIGGHEVVTLSDGSKVELNTATIVHVDVDANHRTASLEEGEAYFQIAHSEGNPFVVTAKGHRITVLGTEFSVRADANKTEVTLFEGRVWFSGGHSSAATNSALLKPGDVLVATVDSTSVVRKSARELASEIGWRRGVLVFGNITLAQAASEFNRYNRQKIVIAAPEIGELRVGGTFPVTDVDDFTHLVRSVLGLRVEKRATETVISR